MSSRFLFGLVNGNLGTFKTYLAEITDSTNQARAFTFIGLTWGVGNVTGALIGGLLARPLQQYDWLEAILPSSIVWFLETFPYVLPNLFVSGISLVGVIFALFFLSESNPAILAKREQKRRAREVSQMAIETMDNLGISDVKVVDEHDVELLDTPLVDNWSNDTDSDSDKQYEEESASILESYDTLKQKDQIILTIAPDASKKESTVPLSDFFEFKPDNLLCIRFPALKIRLPSWWPKNEIARSHMPIMASFCYGMMGLAQVMFDETLPLISKLERSLRGLEMQPYEIGIMSAMIGVIVFVWQLFFCSLITEKLGPLRTYRLGVVSSVVAFVLMPQMGLLASYMPKNSAVSGGVVWIGLFITLVIRHSTSSLVFCAVGLMINNAVSSETLGQLNGLSQSMVAAARFVGPITASVLFSWSISNGLTFPFDTNLVYIIMFATHLFMFFASLILDKRMDVPFNERVEPLKCCK